MRVKIDSVLAAVTSMPWAIEPEKLDAVCAFLSFRANGGVLTADEINAAAAPNRRPQPAQQGAVAVLPLYGVVSQRMGMMTEMSGGTSTEQFARKFDELVARDDVAAIVLDVDSPGGAVEGVAEAAARIFAARSRKRIVAVSNAQMCSAAYWIASAAHEVVAAPSSMTGSIGVYTVHTDVSAADEKDGIKRTVIKAGKYKAEGNPFEPLSDEARGHTQSVVDDVYDLLVTAVARHRGVTAAAVRGGYGQGRALTARQAFEAGLVDRIATLDDVLAELAGGAQTRTGAMQRAATEVALPLAASATTTGSFTAATHALTALRLVPIAAAAASPESAEECPECGAALDDGACPACGYVAPTDGDEHTPTNSQGAGGAAPLTAPTAPASQTAPQGQENTVPENNTAPQPGAAPTVDPRLEAISELAKLAGQSTDHAIAAYRAGKTADQYRAELAAAQPAPTPIVTGVNSRAAAQPYASLGEQLVDIANVGLNRATGATVERLTRVSAAASGASAAVGADGGFLIQKDFATDLMDSGFETGVLASKCATVEIGANADGLEVVTIDHTDRTTGNRFGGVRVYRKGEADTVTASKPQDDKWECRLEDMMALAYATERLLQDAPAMQGVFTQAFSEEFGWKLDNEIYRGTGAGQCMGVITALDASSLGPTVRQAKETGQLADTFVAENAMNMWSHVHPRSRQRGIWVYNPELDPQLLSMQIGTGASGQLVYLPPGGLSGSQYGTIYGRPVVPIEQASAPGDLGDIAFIDLSRYQLIRKGGINAEESIHVRFLYNERAFRWTTRVNGKPKDKAATTPANGSSGFKLSPFVTLAAR